MKKIPNDMNNDCMGHHLELLEIGDFGKLYRCPLCGKSVLDSGNKSNWFLKLVLVLSITLIIFTFIILIGLIFWPEIFNISGLGGDMYSEEHKIFRN